MDGMAAAMHSDIKRSALYNEELKPSQDFLREMQSQYQTSMGLGASFSKDFNARGRRRSRGFRGRGRARYPYQGWSSYQMMQQPLHTPFNAAGRGRTGVAGRGQEDLRICYDYLAGSCLRGGACRYRHANQ